MGEVAQLAEGGRRRRGRPPKAKTNGEAAPERKRARKPRPEIGRFSIDCVGNVTVLDLDLRHGVTLERDAARQLYAFLAGFYARPPDA